MDVKHEEWVKIMGFKDSEEERQYFRVNLLTKKLPVAMYICPKCDEILTNSLECKCEN